MSALCFWYFPRVLELLTWTVVIERILENIPLQVIWPPSAPKVSSSSVRGQQGWTRGMMSWRWEVFVWRDGRRFNPVSRSTCMEKVSNRVWMSTVTDSSHPSLSFHGCWCRTSSSFSHSICHFILPDCIYDRWSGKSSTFKVNKLTFST